MNEERWNVVRQFYMESFGIAPDLVDLMASNDILLMCVSGASNESISRLLNIDIDAISEIIHAILDFDGWVSDLDFNPYSVFRAHTDYIDYVGTVVDIHSGKDGFMIDDIDLSFRISKTYSLIEDRLDKDWI